ncbi:unnamed protein product [Closterium sp. Naga37s-1]|nr:unnamed protein product [Closterium sp. Naga37s-1]
MGDFLRSVWLAKESHMVDAAHAAGGGDLRACDKAAGLLRARSLRRGQVAGWAAVRRERGRAEPWAGKGSGELREGGVIVEGMAGNRGIGVALVGNARGYKTVIGIPDTQSQEKDMLRVAGATLVEVRVQVPAVPYKNPNNYVKYSGRLAHAIAKVPSCSLPSPLSSPPHSPPSPSPTSRCMFFASLLAHPTVHSARHAHSKCSLPPHHALALIFSLCLLMSHYALL